MSRSEPGFFHELFSSMKAVALIIRQFFVRYFLPLHNEAAEPVEHDWELEEEPIRKTEASLPTEEPVEPMPDLHLAAAPVVPIIAPPPGATERVARESVQRTPDNPWGDLEEEPAGGPEGASAQPDDPAPNPFQTDPPGERG